MISRPQGPITCRALYLRRGMIPGMESDKKVLLPSCNAASSGQHTLFLPARAEASRHGDAHEKARPLAGLPGRAWSPATWLHCPLIDLQFQGL